VDIELPPFIADHLKKRFFLIEEKAKSKLRRQIRRQFQLFANVAPRMVRSRDDGAKAEAGGPTP